MTRISSINMLRGYNLIESISIHIGTFFNLIKQLSSILVSLVIQNSMCIDYKVTDNVF